MSARKKETRGHVHELEIEASPEAVWKAITDPEDLANWFPLSAKTEPKAGGSITYDWGYEFQAKLDILAWEPGRHLRTTWMEAVMPAEAGDDERSLVAVDWTLEGAGGKTVLRLVHSGMGADAAWDNEFDGTRRGWTFELRSLRHYLERHAGKKRRAFWLRRPFRGEAREAWRAFLSAALAKGSPEGLRIGDPYRFELKTGDLLEGTTVMHLPPTDFSGTAENLGGALWRYGYEVFGETPEMHLWFSAWGRSADEVGALESRLRRVLGEASGER